MVIICPFRVPLPIAKPFHLAITEFFGDYGSAIALQEDGNTKRLSFGQIKQYSCSLAHVLRNRFGFKKGDVVLSYVENRIEFPVLLLGVSALGGATSGANPLYTPQELGKQLENSGSRYVVTSETRLPVVQKALSGIAGSHNVEVIFLIDATPPLKTINSPIPLIPFEELYSSNASEYPQEYIDPRKDVVLLPYSSGTTGLPKGVMLSHYNLQCLLFSRESMGVFSIADRGDTAIMYLPFFHMAGFMALVWAMYQGALGIVMRQFEPTRYLGALQRHKVSLIGAVPSVLVFLAKDPSVTKYDLSSVENIIFGAAPAGKELIEAIAKRLPNLKFINQAYGLTESGGLATTTPRLPIAQCPIGSCGVPTPYTELKVMSIDGKNQEFGPMDRGEIWLRGPAIMLGYHRNEKATRETLDKDGWLHTGDIGYYDYFGHIYVVDRLKELIKYKGFQVAPAELEDLLLRHPAIQEAAVTGIPDAVNPDVGELPTAFVVLKAGYNASEETAASIKRTVADHLAPFKHLRGGVIFVSQVPKGGSGKILRRLLKDVKEKAYGRESGNQKSKL